MSAEHRQTWTDLYEAVKAAIFSQADKTVDLETPYQDLRLAVWFEPNSAAEPAGVAIIQVLESHRRAQVLAKGRLPLPGVDARSLVLQSFSLTHEEMSAWAPGVQLEHDGTRLWKVKGTPSNHLPAWPAKSGGRRRSR